jgi:hypothetical protein
MKKLMTICAALLMAANVFAQAPQKMSYQAVIRNSSNALVTNTTIGMQISILQGSESGTDVYVETQTPSSNANGLVSLEIGAGNVVSGSFTAINWANGPYFIKTETDPTGGTNYTIIGTSQLLSVPYALHAKTAETITGGNSHYVGELYGGGVVFWVDQTGQHGLICSMIDLSAAQAWSNINSTLIGTTAQSDWDGLSNSNAIVGQASHTSSAAKLCLDYTNADYGTGIYSDWYLPSRGELNDLWNNLKAVQKALDSDGNVATTTMSKGPYWSSSESNNYNAWYFYFSSGNAYDSSKSVTFYVRAVRAF